MVEPRYSEIMLIWTDGTTKKEIKTSKNYKFNLIILLSYSKKLLWNVCVIGPASLGCERYVRVTTYPEHSV